MGSNRTLSVSQAAKELGLSRNAIYQALERGDLRGAKKKVTRLEYRIPIAAVQEYTVNTIQQANSKKKD